MMRAMIIMYVGPTGRPNFRTDYYLSPLVAPDHLLARFPPVYFMCGEKDPMVDDTVLFAARIRSAKQKAADKPGPRTTAATATATATDGSTGGGSRLRRVPSRHAVAVGEYLNYKSSRLYGRRHSQPRQPQTSTQFYIGSSDASSDEGSAGGGRGTVPAALRMTQLPVAQPAAVIKVKLVAGMSHGFMQMYSVLPESKRVASLVGDWLDELLHGAYPISPHSRCASLEDTTDPHCHAVGDLSQTDDDECDADGHPWAVHASVAAHLKPRRLQTPSAAAPPPPPPPPLVACKSPSSPQRGETSPLSPTKRNIFASGHVDKHGIEVVSAADMVRRRGQGLADPLT
ncbi:hypothetical protein H4R21_002994 [Coemansia helicoidea]|nr:hypothetical protein H4R21_002994 [Coemansia helicoidea]